MTTTAGLWRCSSAAMRAAPPAVVSPLMLALTMRQPGLVLPMRSPVSDTQPCAGARP